MKLPFKRQKPKKAQALDVLASVAKTWSDLQVPKRASKGMSKAAKKASKQAAGAKRGLRSTPVKAIGAVAIVGGIGAAAARKLLGGKPEPEYFPPPPVAPAPVMAVADPLPARYEASADELNVQGAAAEVAEAKPDGAEAESPASTDDPAADDAPASGPPKDFPGI